MGTVTSRPFRILADCGKVYRFLVDIYERDWRNGVAAPFFEYAYASFTYWMDISYSYQNRVWEENGEIVAFCFYENPVTDIYFCLRPGYEALAEEMIAYAEAHMGQGGRPPQLILFGGQTALMEAASRRGWVCVWKETNFQLSLENGLAYSLPEGFRFVEPEMISIEKVEECCWKGFGHEQEEGPWSGQYLQNDYQLWTAPHATPEHNVVIVNREGEYVCYGGMWWVPENRLAYLEPLCTVPEYRGRGLAAAAIAELSRRMKALGATHMTGGTDPFYEKIGYRPAVKWTFWKKEA